MSRGRYVNVGTETSYGVGGIPTMLRAIAVSDPVDRGVLIEETIDSQMPADIIGGSLKLSGSLEGNMRPIELMPLLEAVYGVDTDNTTYHTYSLGDPQSLQMEIGESTGAISGQDDYVGVGVKEFNYSAKTKEFMKWDASWFAKNVTTGAYSAPTPSSEVPVASWSVAVLLDDVAVAQATGIEVKMSVGLDEENMVLDDFTVDSLVQTEMSDVSGTIDFTEKEFAQLYHAVYGTTVGTSVPSTNLLGSADLKVRGKDPAGTTVIEFQYPTAVLTKKDRSMSGRGAITKTVEFTVQDEDLTVDVYI